MSLYFGERKIFCPAIFPADEIFYELIKESEFNKNHPSYIKDNKEFIIEFPTVIWILILKGQLYNEISHYYREKFADKG